MKSFKELIEKRKFGNKSKKRPLKIRKNNRHNKDDKKKYDKEEYDYIKHKEKMKDIDKEFNIFLKKSLADIEDY